MPIFGKNEGAAAPAAAAKPGQRVEFSFSTQLAHGSATKKISNFSNVKEMYQAISTAFSVPFGDIVFCTLNTPKIDMNRLLGGQIVFDDFIFAHLRGETKVAEVEKTSSTLGLSITDNGAGSAFIKRIYPDSILAKIPQVSVGDLIEEINGVSMLNKRHSDVANTLKEVPVGSKFVLKLAAVKRQGGDEKHATPAAAAAAAAAAPAVKPPAEEKPAAPSTQNFSDANNSAAIATKVEDLLESFMGIRDGDLASEMISLADGLENKEQFIDLVQENLGAFEFPDEFSLDVWDVIHGGEAALFT
ncbi:tax interaction protein 2 [Capsaspora owczarzaki ATCC 30864]|uniref:Tax interaction protein 2 n=1 Tax=Capsaspora owczarzaki (strain ATCC 30864) TaxID=595528 RepID=A0A0D2U0D0_CAPO3|nr:tax interaction protein 2 [Capsaspora owczarzaki ATCC 30864]KJE88656.1 tax interaction protein 2 [Capsaspora owczarzaki ATCC 30864]|eukprot:XP_004365136.1 tax interaction protein 2 [Capsaspora owczarzaki ATCC 30864]